ncbi:MAG: protein translocase subunit SecF [Proteobacteria bacterium]|nr:MAG: protein translocase subunit SecF [Pseudomonadota bacterium]
MFELIRPGTNYDFIGKWKACVIGSLVVILLGVLAIPVRGLRWGIDFAGGTEVQVHFAEGVTVDEGKIRDAVQSVGVGEPSVVRYGEADASPEFLIRFQGAEEQGDEQNQVVDRIRTALTERVGNLTVDRVEFVGPKVGAELRRDGIKAMVISFALILLYIAFRFTPQFAPGGVIALIHDVLITCSIWVMLGQQFDLQVLAALLAIIGYSINDTIVIFDRIREVMGLHTSQDLPAVINQAVNETLSRTILTSGATMLAIVALLLLGGEVIFPFAATMAIGIIAGSYSTIYIASPIMLLLSNRRAVLEKARKPGAPPAKGKAKARA